MQVVVLRIAVACILSLLIHAEAEFSYPTFPQDASDVTRMRHHRRRRQQSRNERVFLGFLRRSPDFQARRNKFFCERFNGRRCICDESGLRQAVLGGGIQGICHDTVIRVTKEINITDRFFAIFCDYVCPRGSQSCDNVAQQKSCQITGGGRSRIFVGSPVSALFVDLDFTMGSASEGGVARLTGGKTVFSHCTFSHNNATRLGGAISTTGNNTFVDVRSGQFRDNKAVIGGAVHVGDGATMSLSGSFRSNFAIVQGGAIFVQNATVPIFDGVFQNNTLAGGGGSSNIWIDDDSDPTTFGTNVTCSPSNGRVTRVAFCNELAIGEFASGPNNTQAFRNTNCNVEGVVLNLTNELCQ
jgi:predicted outer membrane repeat protein